MPPSRPLAGLDLNLLVALEALGEERQVARAAARLGVTPSALSHTLRRLRDVTGDPLFVRGRDGLKPTPRALAMLEPTRIALRHARLAFSSADTFDPAQTTRTFTVTGSDLFNSVVLPSLGPDLAERHMTLRVVPPPHSVSDALESGALDLVVRATTRGIEDPSVPSWLVQRGLFQDHFRCFVRRGHPALRDGHLPLADWLAARHILVAPQGSATGILDRFLPEGTTRDIALLVPWFLGVPEILRTSDLVVAAPSWLRGLPGADALVDVPLPFDVPSHTLALVWHESRTQDPGHAWLRDQLAEHAEARMRSFRTTSGASSPAAP